MPVPFLVLKNHLYLYDFDLSSGPKRTKSIIALTIRTSVLFAIRLKVVLKAEPDTKSKKKLFRLLAIEEVDFWNHYRIGKNAPENWVALKDFLDSLLGNRTHRVHTSWLDLVQSKKVFNESDDTFFRRFNILKTQIGNADNDPTKIEVMLFFAGLDEPIQQKICKQSSIPKTKHDLVAFA